MIIIFLIFLFILLIIIFTNRNIDNFENMEDNIYTYDTCCSPQQKNHCMTYGKTGVCNYYKKDQSCLCQNAY